MHKKNLLKHVTYLLSIYSNDQYELITPTVLKKRNNYDFVSLVKVSIFSRKYKKYCNKTKYLFCHNTKPYSQQKNVLWKITIVLKQKFTCPDLRKTSKVPIFLLSPFQTNNILFDCMNFCKNLQ